MILSPGNFCSREQRIAALLRALFLVACQFYI
jgi:hypothetical protein